MVTEQELKALIDNDPTFFKPEGSDDVQPDGYVSTVHLFNLLTGSYGEIDNPEPAPQLPAPVTIQGLMQTAPTTLATISEAMLIRIGELIKEQDRDGITAMALILQSRSQMSIGERDAVIALMATKVPDPNWPKRIPAPPKCGDTTLELIDSALGRIV